VSRENVEVVRRAFDLYNARDFVAFFQLFHPDLTYRNREDEPDVRLYRGLDEFKVYVGSWLETFDDLRFETHDFTDLQDEVIAVTDLLGRGRDTGAEVRGSYVFLFSVCNGVIVQGREYPTKAEALEAVGLRE
jgi:ketosteroid isomerase-like protein